MTPRHCIAALLGLITQLTTQHSAVEKVKVNPTEKKRDKRGLLTSGYLTPPSVTLILLISSGARIPNWTLFTVFTGALESLVMIDVILDVLSETF